MTTSMTLQDRAVLTVLRVGSWGARAVDREVTEEVSEQHKAEQDAGTYHKQLIAKRFLKPVKTIAGLAQRTHKTLTLPWEDNGPRILSTVGYKNYTEQMRMLRLKYEHAATEFAANFDEYVKEAKVRLGTMYDPEDYKGTDNVKERFYLDVEIKAVPEAKDFRAKLSDQAVKAIVKDIEARADERLKTAMNDVYERILKVTGHLVDKLKNYEPPTGKGKGNMGKNFQDSTVYNVKELVDILPDLNLTDDPRLVTLQKQLADELLEHSPEILKTDPKVRADVARKADKIYNKVKGFLA